MNSEFNNNQFDNQMNSYQQNPIRMEEPKKKGNNTIVVVLILTALILAAAIVYLLVTPKDEKENNKTTTTTTKAIVKDTGTIISKPEDNGDGEYLLELKKNSDGELIPDEYTYTLNDKFKVNLKIQEGDGAGEIAIYVNNNVFVEKDINWGDDSLKLHVYNDALVYEKTGTSYWIGQAVYVFKNNVSTKLFELDSVSGMYPNEININENGIIIKGNRIDSTCINYGEANSDNEDACLSDNSTWSKYGITEDTIVEATYTYKYENNSLSLTPVVSDQVSIKNYELPQTQED